VEDRIGTVRERVETRVDQAKAALEAGRGAAREAREDLQRRVDEAKRTYREGLSRRRGGDGAAPEVVVEEVSTQEDAGDLA
jgi:hypothetical protein